MRMKIASPISAKTKAATTITAEIFTTRMEEIWNAMMSVLNNNFISTFFNWHCFGVLFGEYQKYIFQVRILAALKSDYFFVCMIFVINFQNSICWKFFLHIESFHSLKYYSYFLLCIELDKIQAIIEMIYVFATST